MKLTILFLLICLQAIFASDEWQTFKATYGKAYKNIQEENFRKQIFLNNLKLIEDQNNKYRQGLSGFSVKINKLADRATEEIHPSARSIDEHVSEFVQKSARPIPRKEAPESIDWRDYGVISPVPDQTFCNSCWAFAVVGAIEANIAIFRKENVSLSQQNLVDCVDPNFNCYDYLDQNMLQKTYEYIVSNNGIDNVDSYPYESKVGECRFTRDNVGGTITGYGNVTKFDEEEMRLIVGDLGPVSATIASDIMWDLYESGIYYNPHCLNGTEPYNHAVVVVGYGNENGEDYWLVKNSWGTWFGDEGYIKMARNKASNCGIATLARYPYML